MKFLKLLILPAIVASLFNPMYAAIAIQQADIAQEAVVIEKKITRDRNLVYGLTALGVAHELYQWMPLIQGYFSAAPVEAPKPEDKTMFQAFKAGLNHLFYTQEGWVSILHYGLSIGGFVMISKVAGKFVHPDTSYWYISAYAPYTQTIKLMQDRLAALQTESLEDNRINSHKEFLGILYERLARQGQSICAYMMYKSKRLDKKDKVNAQQAANSLFNSHNDWLARIGAELDADNPNYGAINGLLTAYDLDIAVQLNYFSIVEGETPYERAVVKRLIKASADQKE